MNMTTEERFWMKVNKTDTCWLWTSIKNNKGYGVFFKGKQILAHRFAYTLAFGEIPEGMMVCHHCDTLSCVRPDHFFVGTNSANMKDAFLKGRLPTVLIRQSHCKRGHELSGENIYQYSYRRTCRVCKLLLKAEKRLKLSA